jgi:hypothetical protein
MNAYGDLKQDRSFQIIPINAPTKIKSHHTADYTDYIAGHKTYFGPYPPSDPTEDRNTYKHEYFFHIYLIR